VPIRPLSPVVTLWDLARGRQIASSWKPLKQLPPAELEIVARAIAEGIAEGRRHGLEMAKADIEEYQANRVGKPPSW
jgi:hypothetical protein